MFIAKYGTNKLCKLKSTITARRCIIESSESAIKTSFFFMFPSLVPTISQEFKGGKFM